MNGDQCHWPKKMMGRGADGGCGTEERPYRPFCRKKRPNDDSRHLVSLEIDFLAQASKALCERSPFDYPEDGSASGLGVPTLPCGLANLTKHLDTRKRQKKSHSGTEKKKKKSSRQAERSRAGNVWVETEEYFRNVALPDIEALSELSSFRSLASRNCFSIPFVGDGLISNAQKDLGDGVGSHGVSIKKDAGIFVREEVNDAVVKVEEVKEEAEQAMEVDNVGAESLPKEEKVCSVSDTSSSVEWVLGSRNRILLATERPSKKRKLLGGDAGLDKLIAACPCGGNSSLCDFCCTGDAQKYPSQLVVCSSCKATVHQKCYGVLEGVDKSWLCSWCKQKNGRSDFGMPCVLCPRQGGALKRVHRISESGGPVEFAHLFCSQWMPEVYVEDLTKMEPILNLEGIKETRRKLVCNLCKVKSGACVRCSNGTCRTSFHPICGREAGNRLEVWGKRGSDIIELRAFCSKHSNVSNTNCFPSQSLKEGPCNGDKMAIDVGTPGTSSDISGNTELREMESPNSRLDGPLLDSSKAQQMDSGILGRNNFEEVTLTDSLSFALILKKLIDRGKVDVKDVAEEIDINPDALSAALTDGKLVPDLQCKIVKWLGKHAYMGTWRKRSKVKSKSGISPKSEIETDDCSEGITVQEFDISDATTIASVALDSQNESKSRGFGYNKLICSSTENFCDHGIVVNATKAGQVFKEEPKSTSMASVACASEKSSIKPNDGQGHSGKRSPELEGDDARQLNCNLSNGSKLDKPASFELNTSQDDGVPICLDSNPVITDLLEAFPGYYVHPYIRKELMQMHKEMFLKNSMRLDADKTATNFDGSEGEISHLQAFSSDSVCFVRHSQNHGCGDTTFQSDDRLSKDRGILNLSPEDAVEGELIYYQHQLLGNMVSRKLLSDGLTHKVAKKLSVEIDAPRQQRWDDVLVNKYFYELREARKQGRKEKRHKEAQAVLAAATAAAAASSRISSLRKENSEESAQQENLLNPTSASRRVGSSSHLMPRAKETLSKMAVLRSPSEKHSNFLQTGSELSRENPRSCDICRRSETLWNLILVCSSCKVAVHLDCYRSVKETTGPWYCELCEELSLSKSSGSSSVNFWEKPYSGAECALCGGTTGAFRKTTNGQWIHAFCAEWVLESTFRRGQVDPVQGMEAIPKGTNICCVCRRKHGACIKCNYGNCQTTFHPSCARSAGFYMIGSGKMPHKAYCEKHSLEQKAKAETQKHGPEELKNLKQYRVELERLRLLCERIVKREKIKKDLVLCSQQILEVKRDHVSQSLLACSPFLLPDVSSESATTSLNKSGSEAIQRSDDVDSTVSVKRRGKAPIPLNTDQKTDDSASSQNQYTRKATQRPPFSGKAIPRKHSIISPIVSEDGEKSSKSKKNSETFAKELVMTSDEASLKNRRLPKGYFYVPVDRLQEEKPLSHDSGFGQDG